jgi:YesN/AraC family two-component response regulator
LLFTVVNLGEVDVIGSISIRQRSQLKIALLDSGLELLDDQRYILIEKIKNAIIEMVHYSNGPFKTNNSHYLSEKLNHNYIILSQLFSEVHGSTIENYIIAQKIERAKELISYNELTLTEIALKLQYCSVAYFSRQFKQTTGLAPSHFKNMQHKSRIALDVI